MKGRQTIIAAGAALLLAGSAAGVDAWKLEYRLEEGQTFPLRMIMDQTVQTKVEGQTVPIESLMTMDLLTEVEDVTEDGNYVLSYTYTRLQGTTTGPDFSMEFDSDAESDDGNPVAKMYGALTGMELRATMEPNGTILNIDGMEQMMAAMLDNAAPGSEAAGKMFNPDEIEKGMKTVLSPMPDYPVSIGDTWKSEMTMGAPIPMVVTMRYTLIGVTDTTYELDLRATFASKPGESAHIELQPGHSMDVELSGVQNGTVSLDRRTCMPVASRTTMDMNMDMTMTMPDAPEPMDLKTTISSVMTLTNPDD